MKSRLITLFAFETYQQARKCEAIKSADVSVNISVMYQHTKVTCSKVRVQICIQERSIEVDVELMLLCGVIWESLMDFDGFLMS